MLNSVYSELSENNDTYATKCCFTGYRPSKFPFKLDCESDAFKALENRILNALSDMVKNGCSTFFSGMAMGFDIITAECVLLIKNMYRVRKIKLICVLPFPEQSKTFGEDWRRRYENILDHADEIVTVSDKYYSGCYSARNRFMVDNSDYVLTWFDGKHGGTENTLNYARKKLRQIINLNDCDSDFYCTEQLPLILK